MPLRSQVLLSAMRALWQVPTPNLRGVAVSWDEQWLRPRFVYDAVPSDEERELASEAATEMVADFAAHKVNENVEATPAPVPLALGSDEEWVYLRHEAGER